MSLINSELDPGPYEDVEQEMFYEHIKGQQAKISGPLDSDRLDGLLAMLGERLELTNIQPIEPIVIGGSALNMSNLVARTTVDVDLVGNAAKPAGSGTAFPEEFWREVREIAKEEGLENNWVNEGPFFTSEILPSGFIQRATRKEYGDKLTMYFADSYDLIHFKLYAGIDTGKYHLADMMDCEPTTEDLVSAVRWIQKKMNPSTAKNKKLLTTLRKLGEDDVVEQVITSPEFSKEVNDEPSP